MEFLYNFHSQREKPESIIGHIPRNNYLIQHMKNLQSSRNINYMKNQNRERGSWVWHILAHTAEARGNLLGNHCGDISIMR